MAIKPTYADGRLYSWLYEAKLQLTVIPVGSWHAFGAGNDIDYIVLDTRPESKYLSQTVADLIGIDFEADESEHYDRDDGRFVSMRRADINLVVTLDSEFAEKSRIAQEVVEALELREKADRVKVFKIVRGYD